MSDRAHSLPSALFGGLVVALLCLMAPQIASAQMFRYQTPEGEVLITNERMTGSGYELLERLDDPSAPESDRSPNSSSSSASSSSSDSEDSVAATTGSSTLPFSRRESSYDDIIREAANFYSVPFGFVKAVIRIESAFQRDAVSHAGAMGLMQLMPSTAESLDVDDPFDARQNIFGGTRFLRLLIDRYDGDINLILSAYNAGDMAVQRHDGIPYRETRQYVASVYYWYQQYSAEQDDT